MKYNFRQQLPYITIMTLMSWLYIYLFPTKYAWLTAIMAGPMIAISLWCLFEYAPRDDSFSILGAFKKYGWIVIAYVIVSCINQYKEYGTCSLLYGLSMTVMSVLAVVILERSIYE